MLGTIYKTQGSAYRKAGAMMLFNDNGEYFGLLSGGCLESNLHKKAMLALHENVAINIEYDSSEEDSEAYRLGLGCGGIIHILLQPILKRNQYLYLPPLLDALNANQLVSYSQFVPDGPKCKGQSQCKLVEQNDIDLDGGSQCDSTQLYSGHWYSHTIQPMLKLLIFGGGQDAQPLAAMAVMMGLQVVICDPRPANAQAKDFSTVEWIERCHPQVVSEQVKAQLSAVVIMMHNKELDASALQSIAHLSLDYCALLGPAHRKNEVLRDAGIDETTLDFELSAPAGLDIGAKLPEEIAVSVLAEYLQQR